MKISFNLRIGTQHPRENLFTTGNLAAVGAEIITDCDGASTGSVDIRGTFVATLEVSGTVDGVNWLPLAIRSVLGGAWVASATAAGAWTFGCGGFKQVRLRMTAFTSGLAACQIVAHNGVGVIAPATTDLLVTNTGAAGAAVTLTLPSAGAGFRHYLTYLRLVRFAAAALTAAATPVVVTTTNLSGSLAFSLPADAGLQGTIFAYQEDFAYPIAASAQATTTTIVLPATPNVIWRATAGYYIAP